MPESLTPPQGLNAVADQKVIYGLPVGIQATGGTNVIIKIPPKFSYKGIARLIILDMQKAQPLGQLKIVNDGFWNPSGKGSAKASVVQPSDVVSRGKTVANPVNPKVASVSGKVVISIS